MKTGIRNFTKSVVVFGPAGCGKTTNAEALMRHFGLSRVIEDWRPGESAPLTGALILSNVDLTDLREETCARRMLTFDEAMGRLRAGDSSSARPDPKPIRNSGVPRNTNTRRAP